MPMSASMRSLQRIRASRVARCCCQRTASVSSDPGASVTLRDAEAIIAAAALARCCRARGKMPEFQRALRSRGQARARQLETVFLVHCVVSLHEGG